MESLTRYRPVPRRIPAPPSRPQTPLERLLAEAVPGVSAIGSAQLPRYPAGPTDFAHNRANIEALDVVQQTMQTSIDAALPKAGGTMTGDLTISGHNIVTDATTGTKIGTASTQKLGFFGATPVAQQANTVDLRTALLNLGFIAVGGSNPLNLNGGNFICGSISAQGVVQGFQAPFHFGNVTIVPATDGDVTLDVTQYIAPVMSLSIGAWLSDHAVIFPAALGFYIFTNNTGNKNATLTTGAGGTVVVAAGKSAIVRCNGTDMKRISPDTTA